MNYQSGDRLKSRYLSSDAFTSLKNKLGGRSITSLGNKNRNRYKIANQGMGILYYINTIYKIISFLILLIIFIYTIPQTRYFLHEKFSNISNHQNDLILNDDINENVENVYNIAPYFLKTDYFLSKQKTDLYKDDGLYVYDNSSKNIIGLTQENSSSTINIRLFSDPEFKNNFLIKVENNNKSSDLSPKQELDLNILSSTTQVLDNEISDNDSSNNDNGYTYQSYVFEGVGYGQIVAKTPPKINPKKDDYVYTRTVDGLKPIARIVKIDEDNETTFTIIYAQLLVSPQNIYQVFFK